MAAKETYKRVKTILVSQPKPERSPYYQLEEKYGLTIDWRPFIHVEGLSAKDFRKFKIYPEEYSAIIFTSLYSIDHFFRMCEELRYKIPEDLKYFCLTEAIANYLQKFIVYRKRKVFAGHADRRGHAGAGRDGPCAAPPCPVCRCLGRPGADRRAGAPARVSVPLMVVVAAAGVLPSSRPRPRPRAEPLPGAARG